MMKKVTLMPTLHFTMKSLQNSTHWLGYFVFIIFIFSLQSCEEKTSPLGQELIQDSERYHIKTDTLNAIDFFVTDTNRVVSYKQQVLFLGNMQNETFGNTKASFAATLVIEREVEDLWKSNDVIDSAELVLKYIPYGPDTHQEISVHKLTEKLGDTTYYSNFDFTPFYDPQNIATNTTIKEDSTIVVALSNDFAQFLFEGEDSLLTSTSFINYFPGIYCQVEQPVTNGGLFNINLNQTISPNAVRLFYHNTDDDKDTTYHFDYKITNAAYNAYTVENDYTGTDILEAQSNSEEEVDNPCYIQGLGGVKSKFYIPELDSYNKESNYAILKAELQIPVVDNYIKTIYPPVSQLYFYSRNEEGNYYPIRDQQEDVGTFSGAYNEDEGYYSFNITRYVTEIMNKVEENKTFYIYPASDNKTPNRVILNSDDAKLVITYTKH